MAEAEIDAGICGHVTRVQAVAAPDGNRVLLTIVSDCPWVQKMAGELREVDPLREITYRGEGPQVLAVAAMSLRHPACPVPSGILKAVEAAAGLALPRDVRVRVSR
ncbi:MAG: hypothetical protein QME94_19800 [Anaerolineae bacterium]|nr:hypothetical protein [Anaerolineae bacterium]